MEKYPIYRKYKNGKEFMKLNSNGILIKVNIVRENTFTITHTDGEWSKTDFYNPDISAESNRNEFEIHYCRAQYLMAKANCEQ
jgi:hypothetical protein